jgi:hypothetical protein
LANPLNKAFILIIPIIAGSFLICLIYAAYFYALPPFYNLHSVEDSGSASLTLASGDQENYWICPAEGHYPPIFLSEDLTFDLNYSISANTSVNVRLYIAGNKMLEKNGTEIGGTLSRTVPSNFPRFPGEWLARIQPSNDGYVLIMTIENNGEENTSVYVSHSVVCYYRLGNLLDFVLVIVSMLLIGSTLVIILARSILLTKHCLKTSRL